MADVFDQATEREMLDRELAISATLNSIRESKVKPNGKCHNCAEPIPAQALFCDADCGADHELRERNRRG